MGSTFFWCHDRGASKSTVMVYTRTHQRVGSVCMTERAPATRQNEPDTKCKNKITLLVTTNLLWKTNTCATMPAPCIEVSRTYNCNEWSCLFHAYSHILIWYQQTDWRRRTNKYESKSTHHANIHTYNIQTQSHTISQGQPTSYE